MKEQKNSPNKNFIQNDLISKNKRLILPSNKSSNNTQISSQLFRLCNRKIDENEDEKKLKQKKININNINIFRLNNASKNVVSISQEKINKRQKEHEENLKKMKEYEKLIEELNKKNNSLLNEIDNIEKEKDNLNKELKDKDDEEKELNEELDNLKSINEEKNREYLQLMQSNQHQQNNNRNNLNNNRQNNNEGNNNNIEEENQSVDNLFGRLMRLQGQVIGENNEGEGQNNNNQEEKSINNSNADLIGDLNEDFGPPMTFIQIDALPVGKYPKKDTYEEKCILCGFNFCYNDSITKLDQCQHTFHKECLANFLLNRLASKCPICKVSLI